MNDDDQQRRSVVKWTAVFDWMSFPLFLVGLLAFVVGVIGLVVAWFVCLVADVGALGTWALNVCFYSELLSLLIGAVDRRQHFRRVSVCGAATLLMLFVIVAITLPGVQ
jgi:hypothetical protein